MTTTDSTIRPFDTRLVDLMEVATHTPGCRRHAAMLKAWTLKWHRDQGRHVRARKLGIWRDGRRFIQIAIYDAGAA